MTKIFVNKNAIKPYFSPKRGKIYGVGNVLGIFANFSGNSGENFIATLSTLHFSLNKLEQIFADSVPLFADDEGDLDGPSSPRPPIK